MVSLFREEFDEYNELEVLSIVSDVVVKFRGFKIVMDSGTDGWILEKQNE